MTSLLAIYGESVARSVSFVCCAGTIGALSVAIFTCDNWQFCCRCLWTALAFAIVMTLFPPPEFFQALAGRP